MLYERACGEFLNNLRFADDVAPISNNLEDLVEMAEEFIKVCKEAGLEVNAKKTKLIANRQ